MKRVIHSILPGLFLIGFNIGTGSITAMAKAGAAYGMSLLWALLLSCLATFFLMGHFGRYALETGETALFAIRHRIHPGVSVFLIIALAVNVSAGIMGVMGVVADVMQEWAGWTSLGWASVGMALVYALYLKGSTAMFQQALAVMVAVMAVCFIAAAILSPPPLMEVVGGLVPRLPESAAGDGAGPHLAVAAMVGTTVSTMVLIMRATLVRDHGWGPADHRAQQRDAAVSALFMFVISAAVMAAAAGTLRPAGMTLEHVSEMLPVLQPIGSAAVGIFAIGIASAGLSSQLPNTSLLPYLLSDFKGVAADLRKPGFRVLVGGMSMLGLTVPLFHARPVEMMLVSQALAALVLPLTVGCIFYLTASRRVMGDSANPFWQNAILSLILCFALFMCAEGLRGILGRL